LKRLIISLCALFVLTGIASAQHDLSPAEIAEAQKWLNMFGTGGGGEWPSITMPEVQAELKLTPDQKTSVERLLAHFTEEMTASIQKSGSKATVQDAIKSDYLAKTYRLLDAHQGERYRQINIQLYGFAAALTAPVQSALKLSDQEKDALTKAYQRHHRELWLSYGEIMGTPVPDLRDLLAKPQRALDADIAANLSADKKGLLAQLAGQKMKLPASTPIYRALRHYRLP
jgi:hypothetical protein